jgi:hypothetical protein
MYCVEIPMTISPEDDQGEDRRKFLATCGRFAAVTPPAITLLLSTTLTSNEVMASTGRTGYGGQGGDSQGENNNNQGYGGRGGQNGQ